MAMLWSRSAKFCLLICVVLVQSISGLPTGNETSLHSPGSFLQGFRRWLPVCGMQRNPLFKSENNSSTAAGINSNNMTRRDNHTSWSVVSSEALWHFVGLNRAAHHHTRTHTNAAAAGVVVDVSNRVGNLTMDELAAAPAPAAPSPTAGPANSIRPPLCETVKQLVRSISLPVAQHTCQVMLIPRPP